MKYGGVTLEHVLAFQIRIMMGNQYNRLVEGMRTGGKLEQPVIACLRLGWNDAFRHTSENTEEANKWSDTKKQQEMACICENLVKEFCEYTKKQSTQERHAYIHEKMEDPEFKKKFESFKVIEGSDKALSFGHIQKMFNIAVKLYLCLKICADSAPNPIILEYGATPVENVWLDPKKLELLSSENVTADCPIDHYILEAIDKRLSNTGACRTSNISTKRFADIPWSKLRGEEDQNYIEIQKEIAALQKNDSKSNLCFDFEGWNR